MRKGIAILIQILVLLSYSFVIYCAWTISPWRTNHETDPLGAMLAVYSLGFPLLIVLGVVLLLTKKPLNLPWRTGLIPTIYAAPYLTEQILKEYHLAPSSYHDWWSHYAYPWTNWFLVMTIFATVFYGILFVMSIIELSRKTPNQAL